MKMFFPQCLQVLILLTVLRPRCINASGKLILFSNCLILVIVLLSVRTQHSLVTFQIKLSLFVTVKGVSYAVKMGPKSELCLPTTDGQMTRFVQVLPLVHAPVSQSRPKSRLSGTVMVTHLVIFERQVKSLETRVQIFPNFWKLNTIVSAIFI